jgi:hypothetical protein
VVQPVELKVSEEQVSADAHVIFDVREERRLRVGQLATLAGHEQHVVVRKLRRARPERRGLRKIVVSYRAIGTPSFGILASGVEMHAATTHVGGELVHRNSHLEQQALERVSLARRDGDTRQVSFASIARETREIGIVDRVRSAGRDGRQRHDTPPFSELHDEPHVAARRHVVQREASRSIGEPDAHR